MHKALTVIALPVRDDEGLATGETIRKEPGAKITKEEWAKAGMSDEAIKEMQDAGSISEDMDAELHPDHRPVPSGVSSIAQMVESAKALIELHGADNVPAEIKKLAALEVRNVSASGENAKGGDNAGGQ
jgi:hypothetical protein